MSFHFSLMNTIKCSTKLTKLNVMLKTILNPYFKGFGIEYEDEHQSHNSQIDNINKNNSNFKTKKQSVYFREYLNVFWDLN